MTHAGWAVVLNRQVFALYMDAELAHRLAAQIGGTVEEVFLEP